MLYRSSWFAASLAASCFALSAFADGSGHCLTQSLQRVLERISPENGALQVDVAASGAIHRLEPWQLDLLKPTLQASTADGKNLGFKVVHSQEFIDAERNTRGRGFWTIFSPSKGEARVASGHFGVVVNGTWFNRNVDEAGQQALMSAPLEGLVNHSEAQNLLRSDFIITQFFEISDEGVRKLEKYYHDRVWFFHEGNPEYKAPYVPLPFTRHSAVPNGENCLTFVFSWLNDHWLGKYPELARVREELGPMRVSEIPSRQIFLNTRSRAYRGTLWVSDRPGLTEQLQKDGLVNDPAGHQLLLNGPAVPARSP